MPNKLNDSIVFLNVCIYYSVFSLYKCQNKGIYILYHYHYLTQAVFFFIYFWINNIKQNLILYSNGKQREHNVFKRTSINLNRCHIYGFDCGDGFVLGQ